MLSQLGLNPNVLRRELSKVGLQGQVDAEAFKALVQFYEDVEGDKEALYSVFTALKQDAEDGVVKQQHVEAAIRELQGTTSQRDLVFVIGAFDVPKISYDPISKRLFAEQWDSSMLPKAEGKHRLYLDRLHLIYQRLRRNKRFQARSGTNQGKPQLTELLGLKGCVGQRRIVMGAISSQPDGGYKLEDTGASVTMDLSEAKVAAGFITENCVVVAEGELGHDGVFHVSAMGFPNCEPRGALPATAQKLNFFGGPEMSADEAVAAELAEVEHGDDRLVFLMNVWLDRQMTFDSLEAIFGGFLEADHIPAMFVLMGDFSSHASTSGNTGSSRGGVSAGMDYLALREGLERLAALIERYPRLVEGSRFVFVPGPGDPGLGDILPQPPLPNFFTQELRRVLPTAVFTTNPCRIRYFSKEVVVFRHDMLKHMRRRCLRPPADLSEGAPPEVAFGHLALTLLQQSHLCPLPLVVQPVHWMYDHALQLYPLPHAVVVADAAPQASFVHEGCTVFNPGCLQEKLFAAYVPFQDDVEPSALPGVE